MTPSELKQKTLKTSPEFFTRKTMQFFGDTMKNYGVRTWNETMNDGTTLELWELYRKHPVKHGLCGPAFFRKDTFERVFRTASGSESR